MSNKNTTMMKSLQEKLEKVHKLSYCLEKVGSKLTTLTLGCIKHIAYIQYICDINKTNEDKAVAGSPSIGCSRKRSVKEESNNTIFSSSEKNPKEGIVSPLINKPE
jgi:hypothetical protein